MRRWMVCAVGLLLYMGMLCTGVSAQTVATEIITGEQDYLLLATISDITDDAIVAAPYYSIVRQDENGRDMDEMLPTKDAIYIEKFRYSYCMEHADSFNTPKLGDNIFISLSKKGNGYVLKNGAFKTDTVDYKILTFLAPASMEGQDCMDDLAALSYFVRTDGKVRDFSFENGTVKVVKDGRELMLYPSDKLKELVTFVADNGKVSDSSKTKDVITDQEVALEKPADYRWVLAMGILVLGLILGGILLSVLLQRDKRQQKEKRNKPS